MSTLLSIRLNDTLLQEMKAHAQILHLSQTDYIRQAIQHMNQEVKKNEIKQQLKKSSLLVRKESMKINQEFSEIEHDPEP